MNKQVLTKTFSFSKWILFFFFAMGLSLTSCSEDYDDSGLEKRIESLEAALSKINDLQSTLNTVKTTADKAASDATKGLADAASALTAAQNAQAAADAAKKAADAAKDAAKAAQDAVDGIDPSAAQTANDALDKAEEALRKAQEALDATGPGTGDLDAVKKIAQDALDKAKEAADAAAKAKQEAIDAVQVKIDDLQTQLNDIKKTGLTPAEMEEIVKALLASEEFKAQMAEVEGNLGQLIGHRLTSIAVIPESHINGIAAITFKSLTYIPQKFIAHDSLGFTTEDAQKGAITISSGDLTVKYHVNPSIGVRTSDVGEPSFITRVNINDMTRSVDPSLDGMIDTPIAPVKGTGKVEDGIYSVSVKKAINDNINRDWLQVDGTYKPDWDGTTDVERFYMASLRLPISEANWTAEEKAAYDADGTVPTVNSEYVRIAETTVTPFIKQVGTKSADGTDDVYDDSGVAPNIYHDLNEQDPDNAKWIHFHDSAALYKSSVNQLVDIYPAWDETLDLKKYVDVCILEQNHASLADWKSYGLEYRFYLPTKPYEQGDNKTDQQRFANIDSPTNGLVTSRTYDINKPNQTAEGREPIIRAELWDKGNNKLVAIRYIKIKWSGKTVDPTPITIEFPINYVSCDTTQMRVYTQSMNEDFYYAIEGQYGYKKEDFHTIYKTLQIQSLTQDGKDITNKNNVGDPLVYTTYDGVTTKIPNPSDPAINYYVGLIPDDNSNTSFNIVWSMDQITEGKLDATDNISDYVLKFKFISSSGGKDIDVTFKVSLTVPTQEFAYQSIYWADNAQPSKTNMEGTSVFNVNPIMYDTNGDGRAPVLDDNSHIETDLMNGYVYVKANGELRPTSVAQFIQMIRQCAEVRFVFDKSRFGKYPHLAGYTTGDNDEELWKTAVGTSPSRDAYDIREYIQDNDLAASINNAFGATAIENMKNLPWDYNETLGHGYAAGMDTARALIRLHESADQMALNGTNSNIGTPAALDLVGKKVPVNLVVKYNAYNQAIVQKFEVFFINPLTIKSKITDEFTDAVVNGSYVEVKEGLTYTDWRGYKVANTPSDATKPNVLDRFTADLYEYYAVNSVVYDVANIKTNLKREGSYLKPTPGFMAGPLPTVISVKQVNADPTGGDPTNGYVEVSSDPEYLGYFNANGTPVNIDYLMYVPVTVNYKWGLVPLQESGKPGVEIKVNNFTAPVEP